jgi:hypothetical protein
VITRASAPDGNTLDAGALDCAHAAVQFTHTSRALGRPVFGDTAGSEGPVCRRLDVA